MGLFGTWSAEGNKKSHKDFFNSLQLRSFLTLFYEILLVSVLRWDFNCFPVPIYIVQLNWQTTQSDV